MIKIPVSIGELIDKISILTIKTKRITDQDKLTNINLELTMLKSEFDKLPRLENISADDLLNDMIEINSIIWDVEDKIRECERNKNFKQIFIELARKVYINNDKRAEIKKKINKLYDSQIVEEKSYTKYL